MALRDRAGKSCRIRRVKLGKQKIKSHRRLLFLKVWGLWMGRWKRAEVDGRGTILAEYCTKGCIGSLHVAQNEILSLDVKGNLDGGVAL